MIAVNKLSKDDLVEIRTTQKPSEIAVIIFGGVIYLLQDYIKA